MFPQKFQKLIFSKTEMIILTTGLTKKTVPNNFNAVLHEEMVDTLFFVRPVDKPCYKNKPFAEDKKN